MDLLSGGQESLSPPRPSPSGAKAAVERSLGPLLQARSIRRVQNRPLWDAYSKGWGSIAGAQEIWCMHVSGSLGWGRPVLSFSRCLRAARSTSRPKRESAPAKADRTSAGRHRSRLALLDSFAWAACAGRLRSNGPMLQQKCCCQ